MSSSIDGHALPQNEFDIPLSLAAAASAQAVQDYASNGAYYQGAPAVLGAQTQKVDARDGREIVPAKLPLKPASTAPRTEPVKQRRVRTGCLTCRERHLKCDESFPRCQNCQKSDRLCKRGVRLNFIDTQVAAPPYTLRSTHDWKVNFLDESRDIASEYVGGFERYPAIRKKTPEPRTSGPYDFYPAAPTSHHGLPAGASLLPTFPPHTQAELSRQLFQTLPEGLASGSTFSDHTMQRSPFVASKIGLGPSNTTRPYLNTAEEVLLMQVFVEEVGLWMDSMDAQKHVYFFPKPGLLGQCLHIDSSPKSYHFTLFPIRCF